MKKYRVEFSEISLGYLKKLDKSVQTIILKWIKKNLVDCNNLKVHGKV